MSDTVEIRPRGLDRLRRSAPVPELSDLARRHDGVVAIVGGAVRDALLGLPYEDLDVVVEGELEDFVRRVEEVRGQRPVPIGDRFQDTRRCVWGGVQVDLSRSQGSLGKDLARRDFTINAMALPLPAEGTGIDDLLDPQGGLADLRAGRIRCARHRVLDEDPLRVLRAVRYAATLPGFVIEPGTEEQLRRRTGKITEVAAERVQAEWRLLLAAPRWVRGLERAADLELCGSTLGDPGDLGACRSWSASGLERRGEEAEARLAALMLDLVAEGSADSLEALAARLRARRWPRRLVSNAATAARWARRLRDVDVRRLAERALAAPRTADLASRLGSAVDPEAVRDSRRLARFARRALEERWVSGTDLLGWGMPEGPTLGTFLEEAARGQVLRRWDGPEEARRWARERAAEISGGSS